MKKSLPVALLAAALLSGCATDAPKTASSESATDQVAAANGSESEAAEEPAEPEAVETTEAPPPPPPPATLNMPVGQTITVDTGEGTLDVQAVEVKSTSEAAEFMDPPTNGRNVGVLVQYLCKTGSCNYNPYDFVLRGPDGTEYDQAFAPDIFGQELSSGTIPAGVPAKGWVVYDAPPGTLSLEYRANMFDGDLASWTLPVT